MVDNTRTTVVGVFQNEGQVSCADQALQSAGIGADKVGIAMRGEHGTAAAGAGTEAGQGAAAGAIIGGILGAATALIIPGIGPVLAGGILATTLGGAAVGGLLGALIGLGIPEEQAQYYNQEFQAGRIVMTVRADGRHDEAWAIMRDCGAYNMQTRPAPAQRLGSHISTEERNVPPPEPRPDLGTDEENRYPYDK